MIIRYIYIVLIVFSLSAFSQESAFKKGEWLKYDLSYSGFLKGGEAEFKLTEEMYEGNKVFHAKATGKSSTMVGFFFKVKDKYESYFEMDKVNPKKFVRDVSEGGYKIRRNIKFNNDNAYITDLKINKKSVKKALNVQDMISSFYYLRNYDTSNLKINDNIEMNIFFDGESFPFKLKYLGDEIIKTVIGKVKTQIFRPLVQSGRVFKAKESVKIWVTADKNKIPVYIKADLAVGSVRVKLKKYKGLSHPLKTL